MIAATRAPAGSTAARQCDREVYRTVPLWPGITWGRDARCSCSWAWRGGVMEVKVRSAACLVHDGRETPLPELLGQLISLLAEALEGELACGTRGGYHRHLREGSEVCPGCREASREYERSRAGKRPAGAAADRAAA